MGADAGIGISQGVGSRSIARALSDSQLDPSKGWGERHTADRLEWRALVDGDASSNISVPDGGTFADTPGDASDVVTREADAFGICTSWECLRPTFGPHRSAITAGHNPDSLRTIFTGPTGMAATLRYRPVAVSVIRTFFNAWASRTVAARFASPRLVTLANSVDALSISGTFEIASRTLLALDEVTDLALPAGVAHAGAHEAHSTTGTFGGAGTDLRRTI